MGIRVVGLAALFGLFKSAPGCGDDSGELFATSYNTPDMGNGGSSSAGPTGGSCNSNSQCCSMTCVLFIFL
jgi:hypothetical protein